MRFQPNKIYNS